MPACELSIHLDREEAVYRPGEVIRGHVRVTVHAEVRCDALTLRLVWRVPPAMGGAPPTKLAGGEWKAGQIHVLPFELRAPDGPLSHEGTLVRVRWSLIARAHLWRARSSKVEAALALAPWTRGELLSRAQGYREAPLHFDGKYAQGELRRITNPREPLVRPVRVPFWPSAAGLIAIFICAVVFVRSEVLLRTLVALVWMGGMALVLARNKPAVVLGFSQVKVKPFRAAPGGLLLVTVHFTAERKVLLREVTLALVGEEIVYGQPEDRRHTLHEERVAMLDPPKLRVVSAGEKLTLRRTFQLPPDAAPSLRVMNNEIRWEARGEIVTADGQECRHAAQVVVWPAPLQEEAI